MEFGGREVGDLPNGMAGLGEEGEGAEAFDLFFGIEPSIGV